MFAGIYSGEGLEALRHYGHQFQGAKRCWRRSQEADKASNSELDRMSDNVYSVQLNPVNEGWTEQTSLQAPSLLVSVKISFTSPETCYIL